MVVIIFVLAASDAQADIFQSKLASDGVTVVESTVPCTDGVGVDAVPSAVLDHRRLQMAFLDGKDLHNISTVVHNLSNSTLVGANLSNASLVQTDLEVANLSNTNLTSANLTFATFINTKLTGANFTDAQIHGAVLMAITNYGFTAAQLYSTANYKSHDLTGVSLAYNNLTGWDFSLQNLSVNFNTCNLTNANVSNSNLTDAILSTATLTNTNFTGAQIKVRQLSQCG